MEPSLLDVSPTGEGSADGEPKANPEWGGDRLNLPLLGDKAAGPGVAPRLGNPHGKGHMTLENISTSFLKRDDLLKLARRRMENKNNLK